LVFGSASSRVLSGHDVSHVTQEPDEAAHPAIIRMLGYDGANLVHLAIAELNAHGDALQEFWAAVAVSSFRMVATVQQDIPATLRAYAVGRVVSHWSGLSRRCWFEW
jgi:hypothetical protein